MTMEDILNVRFSKVKNRTITVRTSSTVQVKQYEPETTMAETSITLEGNLSGLEVATVEEIMQSSIEYAVAVNLLAKGHIDQKEFARRKNSFQGSSATLIAKLKNEEPESRVLKDIAESIG